MGLVQTVGELGGVARRRQLLARGWRDVDLLAAVRSGLLVRPWRGCYALPGAAPEAVRARVLSAQLTCASAARHLGLPVLAEDSRTHLALPSTRGLDPKDARRGDDVVLHRVPAGPGTRAGPGDALCVDPAVAIDHLAHCVRPVAQLAALDAALNRGLFGRERIWSMTATGRRRRAWLATHADPRAQSPGETVARLELVRSGFAVESQARVAGVGAVDLLVEGRVVVEIDGFAYHSDRVAFAEDKRRDRALMLGGVPFLRYPYLAVIAAPAAIARDVAALLARSERAG